MSIFHRNPRPGNRLAILVGTAGLVAMLGACNAVAAVESVRVSAGNDDAEEQISNGNMDRGSSDLELVYDGGTRQLVGMRFRNVNIPQGAYITSATIQFTVDESDSGATNVVVYGQDTDDANGFSNNDFDISGRTPTSASVPWASIPAWASAGTAGADQRTPDLAAIVQEIVDRGGWSDGNDMVFIVAPGTGCSSSACQRTAEAENGDSNAAPLLEIVWSLTPPTGADVGVTLSDSADPVNAGADFSYTAAVTNSGPEIATGVTLVDTLPSGVVFRSATASQGTCTHDGAPTGGVLTCALGSMNVGAGASVNIIVTAPASGSSLSNQASVSATESDGVAGNNNDTEITAIAYHTSQLCYLVADAGGGNGGNDLLTVVDAADFNPATNETNVGTGTGTFNIEANAWNSATGILYAADAGQLGSLNLSTGVFNALPQAIGQGSGSLGNITFSDVDGLTYDGSTGILYGVHARNGADDVLIQISMTTGAHIANAFGPGVDYVRMPAVLGHDITDDIAVDRTTGVMYASVNSGGTSDRLIVVDKFSGATNDIAQITVPDIEGLGTDPSGQLWGVSGTQNILYEIDKATGFGSNGRVLDNGSDYESVDCYAVSPTITADLAVGKTVDEPAPDEGANVTYTVSVSNNGGGPGTSVQLADTLPAGVSYVSHTVSQGTYDAAAGNWYVGTLAVGAGATLTVVAVVDAGTAGNTITNTASVAYATQADPVPANNSASVDITPPGSADLIMLKTSLTLSDPWSGTTNPKAIPGAIVQYTLQITNTGTGAADSDSVIVSDALPANTALVIADFDGATAGPVQFLDGAPSSALVYTFLALGDVTDDVEFSDDNGTTYTYAPADIGDGTDPAVTHVRINPKGNFAFASGANPSFRLRFKTHVQ